MKPEAEAIRVLYQSTVVCQSLKVEFYFARICVGRSQNVDRVGTPLHEEILEGVQRGDGVHDSVGKDFEK